MNSRKIILGVVLVLTSGCAEGRLDGGATAVPAPRLTQVVGGLTSDGEMVQRTAVTEVLPTITSVTVDYTSPSRDSQGGPSTSRDYDRVVAGPVVKQLIAALNELHVPDMGQAMCPRDDNQRFVLSLDNAGTSLSFSLIGCGRIEVVAGGSAQPELAITDKLDALVAAAAGAPAAT